MKTIRLQFFWSCVHTSPCTVSKARGADQSKKRWLWIALESVCACYGAIEIIVVIIIIIIIIIIIKTDCQNRGLSLREAQWRTQDRSKLEARHSTECITHAGHSITFLHFVTLWCWPYDLILTHRRCIVMEYPWFPVPSLVILVSAVVVLSCRQTQTYTVTHRRR